MFSCNKDIMTVHRAIIITCVYMLHRFLVRTKWQITDINCAVCKTEYTVVILRLR